MQNFSPDLCMKYADFRINWNLVSETSMEGTSIKEYEADAPINRWKYHKRVMENAKSCKILLTASFS